MKIGNIVQQPISELIRFIVTGEKIEVGKSAVAYLQKILPEIKDELNIDFDSFEVHPGSHPRDTADVVLYKNGHIVKMFTVKTAVSANIKSAIRQMKKEKRYGEDGLLIFGLYSVKGNAKEKILGLIEIPERVLFTESTDAIYNAILKKVEEKKEKEKLDELSIVAMNESIILETAAAVMGALYGIGENRKAIEENRKAIEENRKAIEENRKAIEENRKAIEENRKAIEKNRKAIENLTEKINTTKAEVLNELNELKKILLKNKNNK